jgi:histidine triad (HIT) family protein
MAMAYNRDNIFAKILEGKIPAARVYEDARTLAFMDAMPQSEGHTLVIPKCEAETIFDIAPDELANLIVATQKIATAVRQAFTPAGMRIIQFNFPAAGQTVFHIHFHIVPIYAGQSLREHARQMADRAILEEQAARIRAALSTN